MRRAVAAAWEVPEAGAAPALAVLAVCFLLGGVAGCLLAGAVSGAGQTSLSAYLEGFLKAAQAGEVEPPGLLLQIWDGVHWPLLALLLGFTALGLIGLPILFAVRGFLLAFSIGAFVRLFGSAGCLLAFLILGIGGAVSIPVLFVLGVQSLLAARALAGRFLGEGRGPSPYGRAYFLRCGGCAAAVCVCLLLERLVVPALLAGTAGAFLAR